MDIWLEGYDKAERQYLVEGFKNGFAIDYEGERIHRLHCRNQKSVNDMPNVVKEYIENELATNRLAGPFNTPPSHPFTCSPIGLKEKSKKGKYRVIQNLSSPYDGTAVNDGIPWQSRTVSYPDVQEAVDFLNEILGHSIDWDLPDDPRIAAGFAYLVEILKDPNPDIRVPSDPLLQKAVAYVIEVLEGIDGTDDNIVTRIYNYTSKTAFMAKTDVKGAFRLVPIRRVDQSLLGFTYEKKFYHDLVLTMGAASSCRIFQRIARAMNWIARTRLHITKSLQYIDDTILIEQSEEICRRKLNLFKDMCSHIGFVIAEEKTEGPATCLTFLGIELDADNRCARLPLEKIEKCKKLIDGLLSKRTTTLVKLQQVLGLLNFACSVIQPGRCFLRRLINLTIDKKSPTTWITLNNWAKLDLKLWNKFLQDFNGVSFFRERKFISNSAIQMYTDAASTAGYGAIFRNKWFSGIWGTQSAKLPIAWMEMYALVAAASLWANDLAYKSVLFLCDNEAVVQIVNKQSTKDRQIMHLVRVLVLVCLKHNVMFRAKHVPGVHNTLADNLSRCRVDLFRRNAKKMKWVVDDQPQILPHHLYPDSLISNMNA